MRHFLVSARRCCLTFDDRPYGFPVPYRKFFAGFSQIVARHQGRPHWAKEHTLGPRDFEMLYPKFALFKDVLESVDPCGVWRSPYIRRHIFGDTSADVEPDIFKARKM